MTTGKYLSDHKKDSYELADEPKKQSNDFYRQTVSNQSNHGL